MQATHMTGSADQIDRIRADVRVALEKATPGVWQVSGIREKLGNHQYARAQAHMVGPDGDGVALVLYEEDHHCQHWADAKYIAAACPANMRLVLDALDAREARIKELEAALRPPPTASPKACRDMTDDELVAENADLARQWEQLCADLEESGGSGGSPGEWIHERSDEIAAEQKCRTAARLLAPAAGSEGSGT